MDDMDVIKKALEKVVIMLKDAIDVIDKHENRILELENEVASMRCTIYNMNSDNDLNDFMQKEKDKSAYDTKLTGVEINRGLELYSKRPTKKLLL